MRSLLFFNTSSRHSTAFIPHESVSQSTRSVEHHLHFYWYLKMAVSLSSMISELLGKVFPPEEPLEVSTARQFLPLKSLCEKDDILIAMLNSKGHEHVCYCIGDPDQADLPIIFASDGFCGFTGYSSEEIEGRNCRFLQGQDTAPKDVDRIRTAIQQEDSKSVNLLNYRKDGSSFANEFFISPLHDSDGKLVYVSRQIVQLESIKRLGSFY
jgi:PAS domain S-box-containing protein